MSAKGDMKSFDAAVKAALLRADPKYDDGFIKKQVGYLYTRIHSTVKSLDTDGLISLAKDLIGFLKKAGKADDGNIDDLYHECTKYFVGLLKGEAEAQSIYREYYGDLFSAILDAEAKLGSKLSLERKKSVIVVRPNQLLPKIPDFIRDKIQFKISEEHEIYTEICDYPTNTTRFVVDLKKLQKKLDALGKGNLRGLARLKREFIECLSKPISFKGKSIKTQKKRKQSYIDAVNLFFKETATIKDKLLRAKVRSLFLQGQIDGFFKYLYKEGCKECRDMENEERDLYWG